MQKSNFVLTDNNIVPTESSEIDNTYSYYLQLLEPFVKTMGWEGIGILAILAIFLVAGGAKKQKKGQIATGRRVGRKEIVSAAKVARSQLKRRKHNEVTLYIGTPRKRGIFNGLLDAMGVPPTIYVPNAQEGISICGAPGKGKTASAIDRLACSAFEQEFPTVVFDYKGEQLRVLAPYAAALGYEVYIFAPGKKYSGTFNPLDSLTGPNDVSMARQLAIAINRNAKKSNNSTQNEYFTDARDALVQTLILLAKDSPYQDLLMSASILKMPGLAKRMLLAQQEGWLNLYADYLATALAAVADSPPTSGGIIGSAFNMFAPLINPDFIPCLCGKSTIPLELKGKRVVFLSWTNGLGMSWLL